MLFCTTYCLPFIAPYLVAEKRSGRGGGRADLPQFILGRLGGYVLFGAVFGWLGERLSGRCSPFSRSSRSSFFRSSDPLRRGPGEAVVVVLLRSKTSRAGRRC